jgi:hypothetical protein
MTDDAMALTNFGLCLKKQCIADKDTQTVRIGRGSRSGAAPLSEWEDIVYTSI